MCDTCDFTTKSTEQLSRHKRKHEAFVVLYLEIIKIGIIRIK